MPRESDSNLAAVIKQATDIVALVSEYGLTVHRSGSKFKTLCPFHDDHNPSLELNPERQSFKCWSCGVGGDVFTFVMAHDRIEFPEALRMLADRAGITLERSDAKASSSGSDGPSKTELLAVCEWAEGVFASELQRSDDALAYAYGRGISDESISRFRLGFAPDSRDWLTLRGRKASFRVEVLESAGLVKRKEEGSNLFRDRFRGRLIFPIHDSRGRTIAFGGRILPENEKRLIEAGLGVAKYLNSPETPLFRKRKTLYASDLARPAARDAKMVAVVEGYTDVIAAHQAGLQNVVGTLGTALGDDHVTALRSLADRVVLVFDGDEAGQKAADRSLELFLGHEVDVRVLTLAEGLDPADFIAQRGAHAFRDALESAGDPLEFILARASNRYDFSSAEGTRQAAQWVLSILAKVPQTGRGGLDLKVAKALDTLSRRLGVPVEELRKELRRHSQAPVSRKTSEPIHLSAVSEEMPPIRVRDLDFLDRELVEIALNAPELVADLHRHLPVEDLRDAPLRAILQACYDLLAEGEHPEFFLVSLRLTERERALAAGLLLPIDPGVLNAGSAPPAAWLDRLATVLPRLELRQWQDGERNLYGALRESDPISDPASHRALNAEYLKHLERRPNPRKK